MATEEKASQPMTRGLRSAASTWSVWRAISTKIAAVGAASGRHTLDASGLLVLPGIVDIHGDAFERQVQPRPGVDFPAALALHDTEAQLLANGITTAFHGITLSWEPGLRSLASWRTLLDALDAGSWICDMRVHLRWEAYNLEALDTAVADIQAGRVHLLAFNDHTPAILSKTADPVQGAKYWPTASPPARRKSPARWTASPPPPATPASHWPATTTTRSPCAMASAPVVPASANSRWPRPSARPPATPATTW